MNVENKKWSLNRSSVKFLGIFIIFVFIMSLREKTFLFLNIEKNYFSVSIFSSVGFAILGLFGFYICFLEMRKKNFEVKRSKEEILVFILACLIFFYSIYFALKGYSII